MAKKKPLEKQEELPELFDFSDMSYDEAYDQDDMMGIMHGMLEASNNQMLIALELTKLIVSNDTVDNREEQVLSAFKKATQVVSENVALKNLIEQMGH